MLKLGKRSIQAGFFFIIILDASKLAQLIYYSVRYLHFSIANQNLRFVISQIFLIPDFRKIRKIE